MHPWLDAIHSVTGAPHQAAGQLQHPAAQRLGHAPGLGHHLHPVRDHRGGIVVQHALDEPRNSLQNGMPRRQWDFVTSVTRFGDLLYFGQLFKAFGSNKFAQISHILRQFL